MNCPYRLLATFALALVSLAGAASELSVLGINPSGEEVPTGRQVVIHFDQPVVALGAPPPGRGTVSLSPDPGCAWRWLDDVSLACELAGGRALAPATEYRLTLAASLTALSGARLGHALEHRFVTERARLVDVYFVHWRGPDRPELRLVFNHAVTRDSVRAHVFARSSRVPRIDLELLHGGDRDTPPPDASWVWHVLPAAGPGLGALVQIEIEPGLRTAAGTLEGVERRTAVTLHTFAELDLVGIKCTAGRSRELRLPAGGTTERCNPQAGVAIGFTAPVLPSQLGRHLRLAPDLARGRENHDPWAAQGDYSRLGSPGEPDRIYWHWLPAPLEAFTDYAMTVDGALRDEFGRALGTTRELALATDHREPDFVLTHRHAVLEKSVDSDAPIVVTNLSRLDVTYQRVDGRGDPARGSYRRELPRVEDIAWRARLGVRDMLEGTSGVVAGEVASEPRVDKHRQGRAFLAQVTPFQVHVKAGHRNTLVWVTRLADGSAVDRARISVVAGSTTRLTDLLSRGATGLARAETGPDGVAMLPGLDLLSPKLERLYKANDAGLFVTVAGDDDVALVPLDWPYQIDTWRASRASVSTWLRTRYGHLRAWGTTAQGVYRAGERIQYKLYVRDEGNERLGPARAGPYQLSVVDPSGKTVFERAAVTLSSFGSHHGEFTVPANAVTGWYRFRLDPAFSEEVLEPMRVLVTDFTPAPFRVAAEVNGRRFLPGDALEITTEATLHAGGPYGDAPARVTATIDARPFEPGTEATRGYRFDVHDPEAPNAQVILHDEASLDGAGRHRSNVPVPESSILHGTIDVESAVRDDRGKSYSGYARATYLARDRLVGLRLEHWTLSEDERASIDAVVVDPQGAAVAGVEIDVSVERLETRGVRVKSAGSTYTMRYERRWLPVSQCRLVSGPAAVPCAFTPTDPGEHRIVAEISDSRGRPHRTHWPTWVVGAGYVLWEGPGTLALDVVPEQATYEVGDTARYLVKNPFPGATALVTVERYGVIRHWSQVLSASTEIVEVPVEPDLVPGFYLSVVVVSPRAAPPDDGPDLGKPAMRLGYVKTVVDDAFKKLRVSATPTEVSYRPGEEVAVEISVDAGPEPLELALVVLDEAVLDLVAGGTRYFDPHRGLNRLEPLDLQNYSLLTRLLGAQRFETKGANAGGGGGTGVDVRSDFRFVAHFEPSLVIEPGEVRRVTFAAPDNLTGWRVLALAASPGDRFGLGEGRFAVSRPTELRPVMPNQVAEGDRFEAGFSVMNRTDLDRRLNVAIEADGALDPPQPTSVRTVIDAEPYRRQTAWLSLEAGRKGRISLRAQAHDAHDADVTVHELPVLARHRTVTLARHGFMEGGAAEVMVDVPTGVRPDIGAVSVAFSPTVIGNIDGAFRYMRDYPYTCWEQTLTRGTMAALYLGLTEHLSPSLEWPDAGQLPQATLDRAANFQAPSGGMSYYVAEDPYVSPYLSAYTALAFGWLAGAGYTVPAAVSERLHGYLDTLLRRDVLPDFYSSGMASSVRAVALAALAAAGQARLEDVERHRRHLPRMSLFGRAHLWLAAQGTPGAAEIAEEARRSVLAHGRESGGKLTFTERLDTGHTRILASSTRTDCAVLAALTGDRSAGSASSARQLARSVVSARGRRDHWENTQENVFCMSALARYAERFESEPVSADVSAAVDGAPIGVARLVGRRTSAALARPLSSADAGRTLSVDLRREGTGPLYYATRLTYAPAEPPAERIAAGLDVRREMSVQRDGAWRILDTASGTATIRRGELVRADIYLELAGPAHFVVIDDPVPGGLEPVDRQLAASSATDAAAADRPSAGGAWWFRHRDWVAYDSRRWSFHHRELRHDAVRFYSDYLPAGRYHLSYAAQAIAPGRFAVPAVRAEQMYDPEVHGQGLTGTLTIER